MHLRDHPTVIIQSIHVWLRYYVIKYRTKLMDVDLKKILVPRSGDSTVHFTLKQGYLIMFTDIERT